MRTTRTPNTSPPSISFPLGQVVATPGALDLLDRTGTNAMDLLQRHQRGDWGSVHPEDAAPEPRQGQGRRNHESAHGFTS